MSRRSHRYSVHDKRGVELLEIERQFLIHRMDPGVPAGAERVHRIRQGYLTVSGPAIRVRQIDDRTVMTVKSGGGLVRQEVEFEIAPEIAAQLFEIAGTQLIEKTRYVVGGWELDVFTGRHAGLLIAEAELETSEDALPPLPDGLELGREVTEEQGFTNQFLSSLDANTAGSLMQMLQSDVDAALRWVRRHCMERDAG